MVEPIKDAVVAHADVAAVQKGALRPICERVCEEHLALSRGFDDRLAATHAGETPVADGAGVAVVAEASIGLADADALTAKTRVQGRARVAIVAGDPVGERLVGAARLGAEVSRARVVVFASGLVGKEQALSVGLTADILCAHAVVRAGFLLAETNPLPTNRIDDAAVGRLARDAVDERVLARVSLRGEGVLGADVTVVA